MLTKTVVLDRIEEIRVQMGGLPCQSPEYLRLRRLRDDLALGQIEFMLADLRALQKIEAENPVEQKH